MVAIFAGAGSGFERGSASVLGGMGLLGASSLGRTGEQLFFNAANGNLLISQEDEFLTGRGPDVSIARTYNSLGELSDDNGDNWRQSTDRRVHDLTGTANSAGSTVERTSGDGSVAIYAWDAAKAAYIATDGAGAHDKLAYSGGIWTWTDGSSQATEKYSAYGTNNWRITEAADTDGNKLTFTYAGANLDRVTTADGSYAQYIWSGANITQIVTGFTDLATTIATTLTRTRYAYDASNRLTSVTVDLTPGDGSVADGKTYVTTYTYDGTSKRVASISQTDGSRVNIAYDASGRVASFTQTVASGVTRVTSIAYGAGYTSVTDPAGQVTRLDYFADGALKKVTSPPAHTGAAAQTVQFTYTATGDVATVTDQLGNITSYGYDAWGNAVSTTDRLGNVVTRTFGARNEVLTETRTGSNAAAAAAQHTVRYVYDGENHLRYIVSAEGAVREYRYTSVGQLQYSIDYPEHSYDVSALAAATSLTELQLNTWRDALADRSSTKISLNAYDARGNLTYTLDYGYATAAGAASTAEGYSRTYFTYDQAGQLLSRYAQGQSAESFVYDGLGRLIASTDVHGGTTSIVFTDSATRTVVTLANGFSQTSTYNKAGELISFAEAGSFVAGGTATHKYDRNGQRRMTTDATGYNSYFLFDKAGRKVADINHYGDVVEYRYDAANRLAATARYTNRLTAEQLALLADPDAGVEIASIRPGGHSYDIWTFHVHDKEGRQIEAINGDGSVTAYEYDKSGRLVRTTAYANLLTATQISGFKTTPPAAPVLPTADAARDSVARTFYDKDGHVVGALDGEGFLSRTLYDEAGQKVEEVAFFNVTTASLRASGTFNQLLASVGSHAEDRHLRFVHDGQGQLRYVVDGFDQVTEHGYNVAGQITHTIRYAGSIAAAGDYSYDAVKALVAASGLASHAATRKSWNVYDAAGRLAFAIDAENAVTGYTYDSVGKAIKTVEFAVKRATSSLPAIATMDSWAAGQVANAANRITRFYHAARGELRFTVDAEGYLTRTDYDAESRVTREVRWAAPISVDDSATITTVNGLAAGSWVDTKYSYDAAGRLYSADDGEGIKRVYSYYANGTLANQWVAYGHADEVRTVYVYDNAGRLARRYDAYGTADQVITYQSYDGLGNLVSITDPNNNVTTRSYDRLGRMLSQTNALNGVVSHQYNAFDDVVKTTDARGNATFFYFDRLGREIASRDAENHVTETDYSVFGEVAGVMRRYNKATGTPNTTTLPSVVAHAKDATTSFEYDRLGRLTKTIDAEGGYEQYTLDAFGQRLSVRNRLGGTVTNVYDRRGLLVAETLPMSSTNSSGTVVASTVTNKFEHDARGNRVRMIEAFGLAEERTTDFVYDKANRLTETRGEAVSVLSQANHSTSSSVTPVVRVKYDARGNVVERSDANGARTLSYYDKLDRVIAELDPLGTYSAHGYDDNGNRLTSRVYATAVALPAVPGGTPPAAPAGEYRETIFAYDKLDRLKSRSMAGLRTGAWNGTAYASAIATVTTTFEYDAAGNLIKTTDGNGGTVFAWFDEVGRKTAQVDQENHLTVWTFDPEGNALTERRFATKATGTPNISAPPSVATSGADRVTNFTYDRNGRRLSEQRTGVVAWTVNANGTLAAASTSATIGYTYNGLGQVTRKTEATGDYVDYGYDNVGRLIQETRAPYTDFQGVTLRPTVRYLYNGLNDLSATRQGAASMAATDRFTRYAYGAGGRLESMTDASGATVSYAYDAAGNAVRESYSRSKADGTSVQEAILYTRDLLGRIASQATASWNGSAWIRGDSQETAFNAYGELSKRGANGLWQEVFDYDKAGRLWRTNSGDGVWRYFVYDANGNQTLAIESEGADLANKTIEQAMALAQGTGASIGAAFVDGTNAAINVFDRRGLATATRLPKRELGTTGTPVDIVVGRTYNAFGEVAGETDARGYTTNYAYNTMGRLVSIQRPTVSITLETGVKQNVAPTETYYFDLGGRLVGLQDANGNRTTRSLLTGTGYGGSEALVTSEWHPDTGVARSGYDLFGDLRHSRDELNRLTHMDYDGMGRLTQAVRPDGLTEYFSYDQLGQRIKHWNSFLGAANAEVTDYDLQGRVTRQVAFGGDTTTTSYAWSSSLATAGMGTFGGWSQTTTYANGKALTEQTDLYGRDLYKSDLGGHVFTFSYDRAGRLAQRNGGETVSFTFLNTGLLGEQFTMTGSYASQNWARKSTLYGYDAAGNLTSERFAEDGEISYQFWHNPYEPDWYYESYSNVYKNGTAIYDALGRMTSWTESGGAVPAASTIHEYDANGNIRRTRTEHRLLDPKGVVYSFVQVHDQWYRYDAMNRVVTAKGTLSGGQIVRGYSGVDYAYDQAGQRVGATRTTSASAQIWDPYYQDPWNPYPEFPTLPSEPGMGGGYVTVYYEAETREEYGYDAGGSLATVRIAQSGYYDNYDGTLTVTPPPATGDLKANYYHDGMGRLTRQIDWLGSGANAAYDRTISYNAKGQVYYETVITKQGSETWTNYVSSDFGIGAAYALGAVVWSTSSSYKNGSYQSQSRTDNTYAWWDGAVQSQIRYKPNASQSTTYTTTYSYSGSGALTSVSVADGRPRTITFVNDMNGQAIRRDEADNNYTNGDPHEIWYRFNGKQVGFTGNNGTLDTDYQTSITNRTRTPGTGAFRFGQTAGAPHSDFDLSLDPITSYSQGGSGGSHTVRGGETLASIAASLWGDSSLWYKLAEANGMTAANALVEGQRLSVPAGVMKSTHNAGTFKPYDPAEIIGDTSPTTPKPPKKNKCGVFGQILLVVIAVAVTVITAGAAVAALAPASAGITGIGAGIGALAAGTTGLGAGALIGIGAASGALGSIVSQGVGVATGIQDKFSWKGVAMAAIAGGVGAGLSAGGAFAKIGSAFARGALTGATSSVLTQGIGVVTGLQDKFDWVGVAAAGLGGGVSSAVGAGLGDMNKYAAQLISNGAGAIANAAVRSLATGTSFGDNLLAALPDVIGSTLGNLIAESVTRPAQPEAAGELLVAGAQDAGATAPAAPAAAAPATPTISQDELREWRRNNRWDLENIELPADRTELQERQTRAQTRIAEETRRRDAILTQLNAARAAGAEARQITRLERQLQRAETGLTRVTTRENNRVAEQQRVVDANVALLGRLNSIEQRALTLARSQPVTLNERVVGTDGKTTTVARSYNIEAAGFQFDSERAAALDAIALSFSMRRILGDNWERGGIIDQVGAKYVAGTVLLGTRASAGNSAGLETGRPYVPGITIGTNTVAVFHIHPTGNSADANFSNPGDVTSFVNENTTRVAAHKPPLTFYLGGNDGSFDMLTYTTSGSHYATNNGYRNFFGTR